jgi:CBS domain-containing protein
MKPKCVEQFMSRAVGTCRPDDRLDVAARIMWDRDCGVVPVTVPEEEGERVVGMLTDRDVCMAAYTQGRALADIPVSTAMSHEVRCCGPGESIRGALGIMASAQIHRLPVVDEKGHLMGMLSLADVAREEDRWKDDVTVRGMVATVEAIAAPRCREVVAAA